MAHYADKISILFKLAHLHFNDLKRMQKVSPQGQNWQVFLRMVVSETPDAPKASLNPASGFPSWLQKGWLGGSSADPLVESRKWPINLLLAETFSISSGRIVDFKAISQHNGLGSGQMGSIG